MITEKKSVLILGASSDIGIELIKKKSRSLIKFQMSYIYLSDLR